MQLPAFQQYPWLAGTLHFAALLVGGIVIAFCVAAWRRRIEPVHPQTPSALLLSMVGLLVILLGWDVAHRFPVLRRAWLVANVVGGLLFVTSIGVALHGLWRFRHLRPRPLDLPRPGRPYAAAALVVAILALLLQSYAAFTKLTHRPFNPLKWDEARRWHVFPHLGCAYYLPDPWVVSDPRNARPAALLTATRVRPTLSMSLVVNRPGPLAAGDVRELARKTIQEIEENGGKVSDPVVQSAGNRILSGVLQCRVQRPGGTFYYLVWMQVYRGYNYRLFFWTPENSGREARKVAEMMIGNFTLLERQP